MAIIGDKSYMKIYVNIVLNFRQGNSFVWWESYSFSVRLPNETYSKLFINQQISYQNGHEFDTCLINCTQVDD